MTFFLPYGMIILMIDLHIHTRHSDGTQTVSELLQIAEQHKLKYISFTDHQTVGAYSELKDSNIRKLFSGTIIPGIEFEFIHDNAKNELLGYGVDTDKLAQHEILSAEYKARRYKTYRADLHNVFTGLGYHLRSLQEMENESTRTGERFLSIMKREIQLGKHNQQLLKQHGLVDYPARKRFWLDEVYQPTGKYYIPVETPSMEEISKMIRDVGGLVFMAHVFRVPNNKGIELLEYATKNKLIDGVEVYYQDKTTAFTNQQIEFLKDYCKKHGLLISGGSDTHGRPNENLSALSVEQIPFVTYKNLRKI